MAVKKLTPEQKRAVWSPPKSNAGAGWHSPGAHYLDGFSDEVRGRYPEPEEVFDKPGRRKCRR